jgi:hypothetical protein
VFRCDLWAIAKKLSVVHIDAFSSIVWTDVLFQDFAEAPWTIKNKRGESPCEPS